MVSGISAVCGATGTEEPFWQAEANAINPASRTMRPIRFFMAKIPWVWGDCVAGQS
jgi:hypothetical protein